TSDPIHKEYISSKHHTCRLGAIMDVNESSSSNSLYDAQYDHDGDHNIREGESFIDSDAPLTLRALVSTKEAGVIIGKGGRNVADLRDHTGVKAGVSKVVQGVQDRVLTVTGTIDGVAK
ncbi:RNA binding protein, heterogenous nuclear RNP-K like protein, partial [Modicella reniformis]